MKPEVPEEAAPQLTGGTGVPKDRVGQILYAISLAAHEYVKSKTEKLSSLRDAVASSLRIDRPKIEPPAQVSEPSHSYVPAYPRRLLDLTESDVHADAAYAKDYARIVHSPAFRRLQGKTQLIPAGENDFFRTRLTHSLEVAEIANRIAMRLNSKFKDSQTPYRVDSDIVVCASLLHDIGHPPFGHSGEEALNGRMEKFGGFEGNAQTLRIVTKLENRLGRGGSLIESDDAGPRGLNLTVGTLASILKYDQESLGPKNEGGELFVSKGYYPSESKTVRELRKALGLAGSDVKLYTLECQIMDIADDIAYSAYDLEDTLEAGIVSPLDLMSIDDATLEQITKDVNYQLKKRLQSTRVDDLVILNHLADVFGTLVLDGEMAKPYDFRERLDRIVFVGRTYFESQQHARNPLVRRQYLETLIEENIAAIDVQFNLSMPWLSTLKIEPNRLVMIEAMKSFNFHRVIASRRLQLHHHRAKRIVETIFDALAADSKGALLSEHQRHLLSKCCDDQERMRLICDIVSSFTDSEASRFYDQLQSGRNPPFMSYSR